ncbi:LysM domain-containing protein [Aeromicrobium sp. IC_218]|uniref:LysM peptidoglycan-binding domain-containing protein n=1 Tax=Aeromicrobium sp. IC_218 TaxID=2545468 RepID=UPI00103FA57F|nr:LysM domain-containing protein [Aeromicrobium sp. IC_218]TCI95683.1 LysM domain-containing protein [Aeromicrobium sp. IC_218]
MRRSSTAVGTGLAAAATAWLAARAPHDLAVVTGPDFAAALESLAALVLLALCAWAGLTGALALLAGRAAWAARVLRHVAPRLVRHVLVGGAVGAGLVVPAAAGATSLDGLPYPERPTGGPVLAERPVVRAASAPAPTPPASHVVRGGESLWAIAADHLPAHAGSDDVARSVRHWHAANRAVLGDDPDLIHPGQRLRPPTKDTP